MKNKSLSKVKFKLTDNCEYSNPKDLNHFNELAQQQLHQYPKNSILQNNRSNLNINNNSSIQSTTLSEVMDGSKSTTSSNTSLILDDLITSKDLLTTKNNQLRNKNLYSNNEINQKKISFEDTKKTNNNIDSLPGTVYEEDDLISVISGSIDNFYGVSFKLKYF